MAAEILEKLVPRLSTPNFTPERVTHLHILPHNNSHFYASRIHDQKWPRSWTWVYRETTPAYWSERDLDPRHSDFKSHALTTRPRCLPQRVDIHVLNVNQGHYCNRCPTVAIKWWRNERCECRHNTTGKMTWKYFQVLNGIRTHDLCVTGAILYQLNYQSHMRAVVCEFGPICSADVILGSSI